MLFKALLTISIITTFAYSMPALAQRKQKQPVVYSCPMHPDITSKKPGKCPKCGMTLRRTEAPSPTPTPTPAATTPDQYAFSSTQIPDVRIIDQHGKPLNFYSDLIKGRNVAIN